MGPIRNTRWEQKRTEGYVIVSNLVVELVCWLLLNILEYSIQAGLACEIFTNVKWMPDDVFWL
jgi:hypothetical protein